MLHPNHPLAGQVVRVVRQTGHSAYAERRWVIELDDGIRLSIPLSWAEPVTEESAPTSVHTPQEHKQVLWVDVTTLLNLATMVRLLTTNPPEEAVCYESANDTLTNPPSTSCESTPCRSAPVPSLGASFSGTKARTDDYGTDDDVRQAPATPLPPPAEGGER